MAEDRIVVVANRLPVSWDGEQWHTSPGGLVRALVPVLQRGDGAWVGWHGTSGFHPEPFGHDGIHQQPVDLSPDELEGFYYGFCNGTLWPLYHDAVVAPQFHRHWWRPYVAVNGRYAERAAAVLGVGDVAWVQDYQLQLVPALLRRMRPEATIGFYLHIPFPPIELFARLPWRREIVEGLLGADVVAFQTRASADNFARAARRFAGAERDGRRDLRWQGRAVHLQPAPIAIDTAHFEETASRPEVQRRAAELVHELGDVEHLILGVDRLDYTKGIDLRLKAFAGLLDREPTARRRYSFVQVAVPSREEVPAYQQLRMEIEQLVGRINGEHGEPGWTPVSYLYRNLPFEELVAYYVAADVMLVTPLRDGMNLVAKEYVASRVGEDGVLVLSEFAGAAEQLRSALLVNPYDVDAMTAAVERATTMTVRQARGRMRRLRRTVREADVFDWARSCLATLAGPVLDAGLRAALAAVAAAPSLLVAADYDGTLAPIVDDPTEAFPHRPALGALTELAACEEVHGAIVSGRARDVLAGLTGEPERVVLIGSHGAEAPGAVVDDEIGELIDALVAVAGRHEGAHVERKPAGGAVHYRHAFQPAEVAAEARRVAAEHGARAIDGKQVVEVVVGDADKGTAVAALRERLGGPPLVFFGDDTTDEDVFGSLGPGDVGVKVGPGPTAARYRVADPEAVAAALLLLLAARKR